MNYPKEYKAAQSTTFVCLRLWAILLLAFLVLAGASGTGAQTPPPRIFFTDLDSGPNSGGESISGFSGAYVTLYGNFFGALQGSSSVTWNGLNCLRVVPATGSYTGWGMPFLWYQKIVVQLGAGCTIGAGNFVITTPVGSSNSVPFTVRSGRIYFVAKTGTDTAGNGSFTSPWATPAKAFGSMVAGDIVYVLGGVTNGGGSYGSVDFGVAGTAAGYTAIVSYPGANPAPTFVDGGSYGAGLACFSGYTAWPCSFITIAGITFRGSPSAMWIRYGGDHVRVIANDMSCPNGDGQQGCFTTNQMNNVAFYGNYTHDNSTVTGNSSKQYHSVYFSTDSNHIDVGWNKWFNNKTCRALQFHSSPLQGGGPTDPTGKNQFDLHVHNNWIDGDRCNGINFATVDPTQGSVEAYNNLIMNTGAGPDATDGGSRAYAAIYIPNITNSGPLGSGIVDLYNNTLYNNGNWDFSGSRGGDFDVALGGGGTVAMKLRNNLSYNAQAATPYIPTYAVFGTLTGSNNLWFGYSGAAPSQLTGNVLSNPLLTGIGNKDFSLQSGSPAIDAGVSTSAPTGIDGVVRPQGSAFDIGAYEFFPGGTVQRPNPPTNLAVVVQ